MPTRIFPVSVDLLVTLQRSHTLRRTQIRSPFHLSLPDRMLFQFAQRRYRNYSQNAGWSSLVARQAHNLKAAGSNPAPATKSILQIWNRLAARDSLGKLYARRPAKNLIQRSSVVERSAVNRLVVGSNPTAGAESTHSSVRHSAEPPATKLVVLATPKARLSLPSKRRYRPIFCVVCILLELF